MNYSRIINPETNRNVNIKSCLGKKILKKYLEQIGGVSSSYDKNRDGYMFEKVFNEKSVHNRSTIIDLINFESGYNRQEIGTRIFDKVKNRTKEIGLKEKSKTEETDIAELDKTMFMYGYPTVNIIHLLKELTRANNDRVGFTDVKHTKYQIPELFKNRTDKFNTPGNLEIDGDKDIMFMTGFVQIGRDIYTTISDHINKIYMNNVNTYVILLNKCNFKVVFDEKEHKLLPKYIETKLLKIQHLQEGRIMRNPNEIKFVFNIKNIKETKRHLPFKKLVKDRDILGGPKYNCVNGSLCVESKLFTYLFSENIITNYSDIDGAIAYWVRNNTLKYGPDSPIKSYCYGDFIKDNSTHDLMIKMLFRKGLLPKNILPEDILPEDILPEDILPEDILAKKILPNNILPKDILPNNILPNNILPNNILPNNILLIDMVRGFALPCPGCQKNYYNYLTNELYDWDYKNCEDWDGVNWTWLKEQ